jgi:hypothetical protein
MSFPLTDYEEVLNEAVAIVQGRCETGRNNVVPFYEKFIHGPQDVIYEIHERVCRIRGAESAGEWARMREDAIDLVNEAAFLVLLLDRQKEAAEKLIAHPTDQDGFHL